LLSLLFIIPLPALRVSAAENEGKAEELDTPEVESSASAFPKMRVSESDESDDAVETIVVIGHRADKAWLEAPAAISFVERDKIQRAQQQLTLGESLAGVPGVFVQNQTNFAQDSRVSIRGFGARANFGIRGIRLIVDGIPLTMPDGQGQVDSIDFSSAERIEVLRGPSSSLYGSSSGGIIEITSEKPSDVPRAAGRATAGSYDYRNYQAKALGSAGRAGYMASLSHQEMDGYRDHARMRNLSLNTWFQFEIDPSSDLTVILNHLYSPVAEDPGGLTAEEVDADRDAAQPRNVRFDTEESIDNTTLGLSYVKAFNSHHETTIANYYTWRDFDGKIPSPSRGIIDLDRFFFGGNIKHVYRDTPWGIPNRLVVGLSMEAQLDRRERHRNEDGHSGALTSKQNEDVTNLGLFLQDEIRLPGNLEFTGSVRYDRIRFGVTDRFLGDGDDSATIHYREWSFTGALQWRPSRMLNPYVRVSTSFDTPTTTSLANPDGGGINSDLKAQKSVNYELGVKGLLLSDRLQYEAAVFHVRVHDELVPFTQGFQTFHENADLSTQTGFELGVSYEPVSGLVASLAYTFLDFEFEDFDSRDGGHYDGKQIPGVPENLVHASLSYAHPVGFYVDWEIQYVDDRYADNANSASADDYLLSDLRVGYDYRVGNWELSPFVGINNLFDEEYIDNLRINDNNLRYFEPAPEINAYGGLSVSYRFGGP
jgi:iron complex outermembrane receptor protein